MEGEIFLSCEVVVRIGAVGFYDSKSAHRFHPLALHLPQRPLSTR
jgi:hypothetical protein